MDTIRPEQLKAIDVPANNEVPSYDSATEQFEWVEAGVGGGHTIQDEGTPLTSRTNLNFVGSGVAATDDAGNNATVITINGVADHAGLTHLAYADALHTGFQPTLSFPLAASLGGTGVANGAACTLTLPNAATTITVGGTIALGGFTLTIPATGTAAIGAGTLSSTSTNDVTGATHTHAITVSPTLLGNGTDQYQVIVTGANPYVPVYSGFLLDGTTGGKTVFTVTNTKVLTFTATDTSGITFTGAAVLTVPATGTAALLNQANSFTLINPLTTIAESWIGPSATAGIYFKGGMIGAGTITPGYKFSVAGGDIGLDPDRYIRFRSGVADEYSIGYDSASDSVRIGTLREGSGRFIDLGGWTGGTGVWVSALFINAWTGNVGIGTTDFTDYTVGGSNLTTKAVIESDIATTAIASNPTLILRNIDTTAGNNSTLGFATTDGTNTAVGAFISGLFNARSASNWTTTDLLFGTGAIGSAPSEKMRITSGGNVGIGTTSPNYLLELNTDSAGKPGAGGLWTVVSDERVKEAITLADLDRCYQIVSELPLKRFTFKDACYTKEQVRDRSALGWIAQDVLSIFPKAVDKHDFTLPGSEDVIKDCLDLNSGQIIAALYGAVQKLIQKVDKLEGGP